MKKHLAVVRIVFFVTVGLLLIATLLRALILPDQIYGYENRKAGQLPRFTWNGFLSAEFQDQMESALGDQTVFSEQLKKGYNQTEASLSLGLIGQIAFQEPARYFPYNGLQIFGEDMLTYAPQPLTDATRAQLDQKLASINGMAVDHPEVDFYAYYIEKDTDINFETGEKTGYYDYIKTGLDTEHCALAAYTVEDFEQFRRDFYRTDHHWNLDGSYAAYQQLLPFLELSDAPLAKGEAFTVSESFSGSKAALTKSAGVWTETFRAYRYDFPAMEIYRNGSETAGDYGKQNLSDEKANYGSYYGGDDGEIIFRTHQEDKDNILIIGESYDNAVLKLLAGHFNNTYSIDLRYYEDYMGHAFDFESYLAEHEIDKVLLIGNVDFYTMEVFSVR